MVDTGPSPGWAPQHNQHWSTDQAINTLYIVVHGPLSDESVIKPISLRITGGDLPHLTVDGTNALTFSPTLSPGGMKRETVP
jgi:hypothetical protein